MKIAIPSKGNDLQSEVDERFARAEGFIIYNDESKDFKFLSNSMSDAHGAGPKAVQKLVEEGINILIIPGLGNNAFEAIKASGIKAYFSIKGTVKENLDKYFEGSLEEISSPTR